MAPALPAPAPAVAAAAAAAAVVAKGAGGRDQSLVLRGLTLSFPPGAKVAVVGRTGSGKTSLASCLLRLYPYSGTIRFDGRDIARRGHTRQAHRARVGFVPQEPVLLGRTVREALLGPTLLDVEEEHKERAGGPGRRTRQRRAARRQAIDAAAWRALEAVGIAGSGEAGGRAVRDVKEQEDEQEEEQDGEEGSSSFLLGQGLDTPLEDGGKNLSVGQRQLLCMARALVDVNRARPRTTSSSSSSSSSSSRSSSSSASSGGRGGVENCGLLICDEATSSLDARTEEMVWHALFSSPSTVVCICHRLHRIRDFTTVVVLDRGRVVEEGAPRDLIARPGSKLRSLVAEAGQQQE